MLLAAGAASAAVLLAFGAGLTFFNDDWDVLLHRRGFTLDAFLRPHNENLALIPIATYKALQAGFGMESTLPFRVASTFVFLLSAGLVFVYLRERIGDRLAALAVIVVLFLGAAWEDLLWPFQMGFFGSIAAGVGMLLALQREDRGGDVLACVLLVVAIASSSVGLAFAAGAAADVLLRRDRWLTRSYVVLLPVFLFGLWYTGWGREADSAASVENAVTAPAFAIEGMASSVAALLGLFALEGPISEAAWLAVAVPLSAGGVALLLWLARTERLHRLRPPNPTRSLFVVAVIGLAFWLAVGLNEAPGRAPSASRYLYPGAVFVLLAAAELWRPARIGARAVIAASIVAVVSVIGNLVALNDGRRLLQRESDLARAELGALEITRDHVKPTYRPVLVPSGSGYLQHVDAGPYLSTVDAFGSPADDPGELADRPEEDRAAADIVLAQALGVTLDSSAEALDPVDEEPARPHKPRGDLRTGRRGCEAHSNGGRKAGTVGIPQGRIALRTDDGTNSAVRLRRFAEKSFPIQVGELDSGSWAVLRLPNDHVSEPWKLQVGPTRRLTACRLGQPGPEPP